MHWVSTHQAFILDQTGTQIILAEGSNQVQVPGHWLAHPRAISIHRTTLKKDATAIKTAALSGYLLPTPGLLYPS